MEKIRKIKSDLELEPHQDEIAKQVEKNVQSIEILSGWFLRQPKPKDTNPREDALLYIKHIEERLNQIKNLL